MAFSILPRPPSIGKRRNPKLGGKGLRRNGKPKTLKPRNSKIKSTRAYTPEFPERNPPRPPSVKLPNRGTRTASVKLPNRGTRTPSVKLPNRGTRTPSSLTRRDQRIRPLRPAPRRDRLKKA